ncbi:MAG: type VI secretion system baseplate subunit TssG [Candidatus Zixiibacteriota bacterium]|nr:MAG: type VI secretion system baseplate subunit TssG [candidate division Zixibacteria bacterium]
MSAPPEKVMPDFCSRRHPFHFTTALNTLDKLGLDVSKVDIIALGEFENYKGEIREQDPKPGTPLDKRTKVTLKVGFSSAVDQMPYQFFYGLFGTRASTGAWEDSARAMMAPFDAAVIRHMAVAEYRDLKSTFGLVEFDHLEKVLNLFAFEAGREGMSFREAMIWSSLFPTFHYWAGNAELVCRVLECLFGHRFRIIENVAAEHPIPESCRYYLGSTSDRLGSGVILGKRFADCDTAYEVIVEDVRPDEIRDFLPGGSTRVKIERALNVFMPGHLQSRVTVRSVGELTQIGEEKRRHYLGYTSHIRA